jgi:hypothetical protein
MSNDRAIWERCPTNVGGGVFVGRNLEGHAGVREVRPRRQEIRSRELEQVYAVASLRKSNPKYRNDCADAIAGNDMSAANTRAEVCAWSRTGRSVGRTHRVCSAREHYARQYASSRGLSGNIGDSTPGTCVC